MEEVFDGMKHTLVWIYWWIINGISSIIDFIGEFFSLFAGNPSVGEEGTSFLGSFFTGLDIVKFYTFTSGIAFILMLLIAILTIIKQDYFDKDGPRSKAPIITNIALGFLLFISLVPLSTIAMMVFNEVFKSVYIAMGSGNQIINISDSLIGGALGSSGNSWKELFPSGEAGSGSLLYSFFNLDESMPLQGFHWHLLLVGGAFIAWNLFSMVIDLVKRVFNIIILYVTAPFEIARMVSDDGIRFKKWKDKMVAQLTSLVVIVIAFMIFNLISGAAVNVSESVSSYTTVEQISNDPNEGPGEGEVEIPDERNIGGAFVIIVMMGGSLAVRSASKLVSELAGGDSVIIKERTRSDNNNVRDKSGSDKNAQTKPRILTRTITRDTTRTISTRGATTGSSNRTNVSGVAGTIQSPGGAASFTDRYSGSNTNVASPTPLQRPTSKLLMRTSDSTSRPTTTGRDITRGNYYGGSGPNLDTRVISNTLSTGFREAPTNFGLTPPKWSEENENTIKERGNNYVQASMNFDSSIASNSNFEALSKAINSYLSAADKEKEIIKKEVATGQKDIQPMRKTFNRAESNEYKRVNMGYQKAHNDYAKTTGKISSAISSPGTNPQEIIRLKEQADRQRQKLITAANQAKKFYENKKRGE
ncbi:TPA: hypothetical protein GXZ34_01320 [bacterium]|nr:hypothetical protein [bacterium]